MRKEFHSAVLTLPRAEQELTSLLQEIKPIRMKARVELEHPRLNRNPIMGTCCIITIACITNTPGARCIFHDCATSKGYQNCMECQHWSNPSDPCNLEKVSRNYCPAILRHRDATI